VRKFLTFLPADRVDSGGRKRAPKSNAKANKPKIADLGAKSEKPIAVISLPTAIANAAPLRSSLATNKVLPAKPVTDPEAASIEMMIAEYNALSKSGQDQFLGMIGCIRLSDIPDAVVLPIIPGNDIPAAEAA